MRNRIVAVLFALSMSAGHAASVVDKDPLDYPLRQYVFLLGVALLGGLVSFYTKVKNGSAHAWNLMHLIGELATSAFAGLLAFWVCAYANTPPLIMAALVGVAGHMGTRAIVLVEEWAAKRFGSQRDRGDQR